MSRRHRRMHRGAGAAGADSLDLLLGPMCNTFGGIVLTAVVLALLTREVDTDAATTARRQLQAQAAVDTREMLERRLAKADDDLAKAQAFEQSLQARSNDPALAGRLRLAAERLRLRAQLDAAQAAPVKGEASTSPGGFDASDPGVAAGELKKTLGGVLHAAMEQENARVALDDNLARLRRRQTELSGQLQNEKDRSVQKLRLPKEHAKTKLPYFVILRYGLMYPRYFFSGGKLEENDTTITLTRGDEETLLEPRPRQGLDPQKDQAAITNILRAVPSGEAYVAFIVYQDSFGTFEAAKKQATDLGLEYGWDAFEDGKPLVFSKEGRSAAPPL